jgi:hypothetical protein
VSLSDLVLWGVILSACVAFWVFVVAVAVG